MTWLISKPAYKSKASLDSRSWGRTEVLKRVFDSVPLWMSKTLSALTGGPSIHQPVWSWSTNWGRAGSQCYCLAEKEIPLKAVKTGAGSRSPQKCGLQTHLGPEKWRAPDVRKECFLLEKKHPSALLLLRYVAPLSPKGNKPTTRLSAVLHWRAKGGAAGLINVQAKLWFP